MVNATEKARKPILDLVLPFFLIVGSVIVAIFVPSEIGVLSAFIITLAIYILRRYDFRFLIGMGVLLLLLSAAAFAWKGETTANQVAISAFYFLAIGAVSTLIDFMRNR